MAKPQIWLGIAYVVYQIGQYLSYVKYCSTQSWPCDAIFLYADDAHHKKLQSLSHPQAQQNCVYISWDILYDVSLTHCSQEMPYGIDKLG